MIGLLTAFLFSPSGPTRLIPKYFDLRQPACASHLSRTRAALPNLRLHTSRLTLRPTRDRDRTVLHQFLKDGDITRYFLNAPDSTSADIERYVQKLREGVRVHYSPRLSWVRILRLVAVERGHARPIGVVLIQRAETSGRWEIGYALAAAARGRGFGREMIEGACAAIAAVDPEAVVEAYPDVNNRASQRALERAGFVNQGAYRANAKAKPEWRYTRQAVSADPSPAE